MITLTMCLAPATVTLAKGSLYLQTGWDTSSELERITGPSIQLHEPKYESLCVDIFGFVGVEYKAPTGIGCEERFQGWPPEHDPIVPLVDDLKEKRFLGGLACIEIDEWFRTSGFVDSAADMTTLNAVRSVVSAAVSERGGIVVS